MIRHSLLPLLAFVGLLGTSACKEETTPPAQAPQTTAGTAAGTTESELTAGDTFGVMEALHNAEIEHGTMAQNKASDPRVRAFATRVVNDHKARMAKDHQLMSGLDIKPKDTDVSNHIKSASDRQTSNLSSLSGSDFDRAYLDEQISYYRMALDTFDTNLIPNARDPQVRATLQNAREKANAHLRDAQDLRGSISSQTPPPSSY